MVREKCRGNHAIDWKFCAARHERSEHNSHLAVTVAGKGSGCHDGRNAASKTDQHWDKGTSRQTNFSQQLIHNKRNTRHVSAVFQKRKEEEQQNNDWKEGKNTSNTGADTIDNQGVKPWGNVGCNEDIGKHCSKAVNPCTQKIL